MIVGEYELYMRFIDYIKQIPCDNLAVITDKNERLTYGELLDRAEHISQQIERPALVFVLCKNTIGSFMTYVACLIHHIPVVLLDAEKDDTIISNLIGAYQPEYIYKDDKLIKLKSSKQSLHPDLSVCLTTSGSTGSPKFVRLTERNLVSNAESIAQYLHITAQERPLLLLPMHYSFGMSIINSHLIKGATILLTDKTLAQREFWNFLKQEKATSLSGVPYTFEMLVRLRFYRQWQTMPYLKTLTQAGGKLQAEQVRQWVEWAEEQHKQFIVMYGQTEAAPRMSYLPFEHAKEKYASIGVAIPNGEFMLAEDGELIYKGDNVSMGYAECRADLAKDDENGGILHTGDMARVDEEGFYYIVGRKKRFVKVWGNRCNLDAIEQIVKQITVSCAVVGVDDKITVFITSESSQEDILRLLVQKTGFNPQAFEIRLIDAIPVSDSGKIRYQQLQSML